MKLIRAELGKRVRELRHPTELPCPSVEDEHVPVFCEVFARMKIKIGFPSPMT